MTDELSPAAALAKLRWDKKTKAERSEYASRIARQISPAKAKARAEKAAKTRRRNARNKKKSENS